MSRSRFFMGLALASGLLFACNLDQSSSDVEPPAEEVPPRASSTLPASDTTSSQSSTPAPTSSDASSDAGSDASADAGGNKKTDASPDAAKDSSPALIPFGSTCVLSSQCATGLCLPFKDKGLRCTKTCNSDDDCPNNNDCGDNPSVCEID